MKGSFTQHLLRCSAVERALDIRREEAEVRLARIQNGAEPSHRNTPWPVELVEFVGEVSKGWQWRSHSGRVSPMFRSKVQAEGWRKVHPAWD
jgi:hypothetical protein